MKFSELETRLKDNHIPLSPLAVSLQLAICLQHVFAKNFLNIMLNVLIVYSL